MYRIPTLVFAAALLLTACGQPLGGQNTKSAAEPVAPTTNTTTTDDSDLAPGMFAPEVKPTVDAGQQADRVFVGKLRAHHEEGVAMANLARDRAEHTELAALAGQMITAQETELKELEAWLDASGAGSSMVQPSAGSSMGQPPGAFPGAGSPTVRPPIAGSPMDQPGMTDHLQDKMGTASNTSLEALKNAKPFDLAFLDAMVPHHQDAVALAKTVLLDTKDPAIRTLAEKVARVQGDEIAQMQKWRAAWYPKADAAPGPA